MIISPCNANTLSCASIKWAIYGRLSVEILSTNLSLIDFTYKIAQKYWLFSFVSFSSLCCFTLAIYIFFVVAWILG